MTTSKNKEACITQASFATSRIIEILYHICIYSTKHYRTIYFSDTNAFYYRHLSVLLTIGEPYLHSFYNAYEKHSLF
jgi:hypothetical protein